MKTKFVIIILFFAISFFGFYPVYGQYIGNPPSEKKKGFKLKPIVDVPIVAGCGAWSVYALSQLYSKGPSSEDQILALNKNDVNIIDRNGMYGYNEQFDKNSYYPFYSAIPLPLVFFLTGDGMRSDYLKLTFLYLETMSVTGLLGTSATYFNNKYRPYAYDSLTPMDKRMNQNAKNSFYAGHVEIIAVSTFFISEVYASYYPDSKIKWLFFGCAGLATAGMGYARIRAGEHFPSDVILGSAAGALTGILVPYFHSHKLIKNTDLSFTPLISPSINGLSMVYNFNSSNSKPNSQ